MPISEKEAQELRDELHNLDIYDFLDQKIYYKKLAYLIASGEEFSDEVYLDARSRRTIGYGFNMDRGDAAKNEWNRCLKGKVSFDDAIRGAASITKEQGLMLKLFAIYKVQAKLAKIYEPYWYKMRLNERAVIIDIYYYTPHLAGEGSRLLKYMKNYYKSNDPKYLKLACVEIKDHFSFLNNNEGMAEQRSRNYIRSIIFNSEQCPLYSKPADELIPTSKQIEIIPGETVIPREVSKAYPKSQQLYTYYIWRTTMDDRVLPSHAKYEGKVFKHEDKIKHPGEEFRCRCYMQELPIHAKIIEPDYKSTPDYYQFDEQEGEDSRKLYLLNSNHQIKIFNG